MSTNQIILWLVIGLVGGTCLLYLARKNNKRKEKLILGVGLLIAALIYLGFALVWGNWKWFGIETLGVIGYGVFFYLGKRFHFAWMGVGWFLHPLWDVVLHLNGPGEQIVPAWYALACVSFDVLVGTYIFYRCFKK